jgi:SHS2 domain-containing protein
LSYRLLDHTADLRVEIHGRDLPELFRNAAGALFDLLTDVGSVRPAQQERVRVSGDDREDLLAEWLRELLYRYHAHGRLCCRFEPLCVDETSLSCETWGEPRSADRHPPRHDIKAVTYHGLSVLEGTDGWIAEVVFDV